MYVGHIKLKAGWIVCAFSELSNPNKRYAGKSRFTDANHYEFLLGNEFIKMARKPG